MEELHPTNGKIKSIYHHASKMTYKDVRGFQGGPQLGSPDAERRQSLG